MARRSSPANGRGRERAHLSPHSQPSPLPALPTPRPSPPHSLPTPHHWLLSHALLLPHIRSKHVFIILGCDDPIKKGHNFFQKEFGNLWSKKTFLIFQSPASTVQHCKIIYFTSQHCTTLQNTILHSKTLDSSAQYCTRSDTSCLLSHMMCRPEPRQYLACV